MIMTLLELLEKTTSYFTSKGIDSPRLQAELLTAHVLEKPRLALYLDFDRPMTEPELDRLRPLVQRRGSHEPVQYILGTTSFFGLELKVTPAVLIPRPETEWFVELVMDKVADCEVAPLTIADIGTGSGAIALALATALPQARILATDTSPDALEIARENAAAHPDLKVEFFEGHLLDPLPEVPSAIVANLPYLTDEEMRHLPKDVQQEPASALGGGADGLEYITALLESIPAATSFLGLELGLNQAPALAEKLNTCGWNATSQSDPSDRLRYLIATRSGPK